MDCASAILMLTQVRSQWMGVGPLHIGKAPRPSMFRCGIAQVQRRMITLLRFGHISVEGILEIQHIWERDLVLVVEESDFGVARQKGIIVDNAHFGPLNGGMLMSDVREVAHQHMVDNFPPGDHMLMHCWEANCHPMELPLEDCGREEGPERFFFTPASYIM